MGDHALSLHDYPTRAELLELEMRRDKAYSCVMTDQPNQAPNTVVDSLARSKAQIEAGEAVPMQPVLDRLRDSIARMDARRTTPAVRKA